VCVCVGPGEGEVGGEGAEQQQWDKGGGGAVGDSNLKE
jgi:hypothetical protein